MLCLENGGLKCWNQSMEVGGTWMRQEEIIKILSGSRIYVLFAFNGGGKLVQKSSNLENWKRQQSKILGKWLERRWGPIAGKIS